MFYGNIKKLTKENTNFRKVIFTGNWCQLVVMSIPPGEEIGEEVHQGTDQLLFGVEGSGEAMLNNRTFEFKEKNVVFVPSGDLHNFKNVGNKDLKLYTIYAPPAHPDETVHKTKSDAEGEEGSPDEDDLNDEGGVIA